MDKRIFISCFKDIREQIEKRAESIYEGIGVQTRNIDDADIFLIVDDFEDQEERHEAEKNNIRIVKVNKELIEKEIQMKLLLSDEYREWK